MLNSTKNREYIVLLSSDEEDDNDVAASLGVNKGSVQTPFTTPNLQSSPRSVTLNTSFLDSRRNASQTADSQTTREDSVEYIGRKNINNLMLINRFGFRMKSKDIGSERYKKQTPVAAKDIANRAQDGTNPSQLKEDYGSSRQNSIAIVDRSPRVQSNNPKRSTHQLESKQPRKKTKRDPVPDGHTAGTSKMPSMTIYDIQDFDLKDKVQRLQAIFPRLALRKLYDTLLRVQGDFEAARNSIQFEEERVIVGTGEKSFGSSDAAIKTEQEDKKIKIDFNDPAFIFDTDAPIYPSKHPRSHRYQSPAKPKPAKPKPTKPQPTKPQPAKPKCTKPMPAKRKSVRVVHAATGKKRSISDDSNRSYSPVDDFLAPDDDGSINWSDSYVASDTSDPAESEPSKPRQNSDEDDKEDDKEDLPIDQGKPNLTGNSTKKSYSNKGKEQKSAEPKTKKGARATPLANAGGHRLTKAGVRVHT